MRLRSLLGPVVVLALLPGCSAATGDPPQDNESTGRAAERVNQVSSAYCSISVTGHGSVDMELDYLPHVIACENNGAGLEALKAQAIAARSVAYYNMATQSVAPSRTGARKERGGGSLREIRRGGRETR